MQKRSSQLHKSQTKKVGSARGHAQEEPDRANAALSPVGSGLLETPKTHSRGTRQNSRCDLVWNPSQIPALLREAAPVPADLGPAAEATSL